MVARRCVNLRGNPRLRQGAARKLHHVWAATSEGAEPPLTLEDAKSSLSRPPKKGCYGTVGGVEKFGAEWQKSVRLERRSPEVTRTAAQCPHPRRSGSARELFIHKKKRLGEERVSQKPSRRRGPHSAASPGHVPRLRGTRTGLRGRRCVRRPGAAPCHRPASGEGDPMPGTLRSSAPRSGLGQGAGVGTGPGGRGRGSCPLSVVRGHFPSQPHGTRAAGEQRSAHVPSLAPFTLATCPSVSVNFFLSSSPPLISLSPALEGDPGHLR